MLCDPFTVSCECLPIPNFSLGTGSELNNLVPPQVEQHYNDWCCEQNHLIDGIALFLFLLTVLGHAANASGHASRFFLVIMICNTCVLAKLWLIDSAKYKKWWMALRSVMCATPQFLSHNSTFDLSTIADICATGAK
jgi:hypothetical protein